MKTTLILAASLFVTIGAFGQGTIIFNNTFSGGKAPVYDFDPLAPTTQKTGNTANGTPAGGQTYGGALLSGTGYTAEIWGNLGAGGQADTALHGLGQTTVFRTGTAAGFVVAGSVAVPGALLGTANTFGGTFQLRVWNNAGGTRTSWDTALIRGKSPTFDIAALGGTGTPATPDPNMAGLQSFNIAVVPEPSSIALGVLGLGTLLFLRRRK